MEFARLMVTVDLSPTTADRIKLASALAKQFGGKLIGAAAREIRFPDFMPGKGLDARVLDALELRAKADLESAKELFFREVDNAVRPAWRSDTEVAPGLSDQREPQCGLARGGPSRPRRW